MIDLALALAALVLGLAAFVVVVRDLRPRHRRRAVVARPGPAHRVPRAGLAGRLGTR